MIKTFILIAIIIYIITYIKKVGKLEVYHQNNELYNKMSTLHKKYYPTLLNNSFLTILYKFYFINKEIKYKGAKEYLESFINPDTNNKIILKVISNDSKNPNIVIIPGIDGNYKSYYLYNFINLCLANKWNCYIIFFQGYKYDGNSIIQSNNNNLFSPNYILDLKYILNYINNDIFIVGYSLGSLMLTKYLTIYDNPKIKGCISLSNPWDIYKTIKYWKEEFTIIDKYIYMKMFKEYLITYMRFNKNHFNNVLSIKDIQNISITNIENIKVKTLFIHSYDDYLTPIIHMPIKELKQNPNCFIVLTNFGGHLGWFDIQHNNYIDYICIDYIKNLI